MKSLILCATLALAAACADKEDSSHAVTECAKVLCEADEYCRSVTGGAAPDSANPYEQDPPSCTVAPEACGGVPSCDCIEDCSDCTDDDGVYCSIDAP